MDIFVGSIPFKLKEKDLIALFEPFGEVKTATIVISKITRQNKGFGFVEMPNEDEANKAIVALNGSELLGRKLEVSISEKREVSIKPSKPKVFSGNKGTFRGMGKGYDKRTKK